MVLQIVTKANRVCIIYIYICLCVTKKENKKSSYVLYVYDIDIRCEI